MGKQGHAGRVGPTGTDLTGRQGKIGYFIIMGLSFFIIASCLIVGVIAGITSLRPNLLPELGENLRQADTIRKFSPQSTLFIIGPHANHPACRLQRRLLKPAIPALIREDVTVMEVYGAERPRRNGEPVDWLDSSLLRHALAAEDGFFVIYVDENGKTRFHSPAPMVTADILRCGRLAIAAPGRAPARRSSVLDKLSAA